MRKIQDELVVPSWLNVARSDPEADGWVFADEVGWWYQPAEPCVIQVAEIVRSECGRTILATNGKGYLAKYGQKAKAGEILWLFPDHDRHGCVWGIKRAKDLQEK